MPHCCGSDDRAGLKLSMVERSGSRENGITVNAHELTEELKRIGDLLEQYYNNGVLKKDVTIDIGNGRMDFPKVIEAIRAAQSGVFLASFFRTLADRLEKTGKASCH